MAQRREDEYAYDDPETTYDPDAEARRRALQDSLSQPADLPGPDPVQPEDPGQGITDPPARDPSPPPPPPPAAPPPRDPSIPSNDTPWVPDGQGSWMPPPEQAPPGKHWDPHMANWVDNPPPAGSTGGGRPTGGSLTDPGYAAQYVAWAGTQPGVNPSVKNDPNYWIGRFTSGAFGNDQDYALMRMMQAEGPPEGSTAAKTSSYISPASYAPPTYQTSQPSTNFASDPSQFAGHPQVDQFGQNIRNQIMALLNQKPVSADDEDLAPAISAYKVASERSLQQERDQIAESAYAQRLGGAGATDQAMLAARERAGGNQATFSGNLVAQQAQARRQQITQLLQVGAGVMTADQAQALQAEAQRLDAFLRQQSITNANNQFNDRLGFDIGSFQANMNRNAVLDAMQGGL